MNIIIDASKHNEDGYNEGSTTGAIAHVMFALLNSKENYFKIDAVIDKFGFAVSQSTLGAIVSQVKKRFSIKNVHVKKRGRNVYLIKKTEGQGINIKNEGHDIVKKVINEYGKNGITATDLYRRTRQLTTEGRKEIINELLENNVIVVKNTQNHGTKPTKRYFII